MYSVPDPFGPEIGIETSTLPDEPLTLMLPEIRNPDSIGSPSAATTSGFDRA
jgi:hypothetical protein